VGARLLQRVQGRGSALADGRGRAIGFALAPGQAHEPPMAPRLLDRLDAVPRWLVADRGYSSHAFRQHVRDIGAGPATPCRSNHPFAAATTPFAAATRSR
jgi:hypothetical protein